MSGVPITILIALTVLTAILLVLGVVLDVTRERPYRRAAASLRTTDRHAELEALRTAWARADVDWLVVTGSPALGDSDGAHSPRHSRDSA